MAAKTKSALYSIALVSVFLLNSGKAAPPEIGVIAQSPYLSEPQISPGGDYFFARVASDPDRIFSVFSWKDGSLSPLFLTREDDEIFVQWSRWANENTLLLRIGRYSHRKVSIRVAGQNEEYPTNYASSLYVLNISNGGIGEQKPIRKLSEDGALVSVLPHDPDHILLQEVHKGRLPEVYRVNIHEEEKPVLIKEKVKGVYEWDADRNGDVRIGYGINNRGDNVLLAKVKNEASFRDYSSKIEDVDQRFQPLAFSEDENQIYVVSNHETDTTALYLFDIRTGEFVEKIYHNPSFDVTGVNVHQTTGKLQGVTFEAEETKTVWFDDALKAEIDDIKANFPEYFVNLYSFTEDALFGMVEVSAPHFSGQYYIYDRAAGRLFELPEQYQGLPSSMLGRQFAVTYGSRDGLQIPAFITLPPGFSRIEDAKALPFIIMPHGGPAARDFAGFDIWAQSYAVLGYGVLQMNFRGSTGYGLSFEKAGRQQWGQLMQDDITDGVRWLVAEGIADPGRIAIVGASYGGYAALMGVIKTPHLFQCAISFAGVTNLFDLVNSADKDSYVTRLVGDKFKQGDDLRYNSPLFRAEDVGAPIMLLHGFLDGIVPYDHSEDMETRLKSAGKDVEFVTMSHSGHGLNDYEDRIQFYTEQRRYIRNCLGK